MKTIITILTLLLFGTSIPNDGYILCQMKSDSTFIVLDDDIFTDAQLTRAVQQAKKQGVDCDSMLYIWWEISFVPGFGDPPNAPSDQFLIVTAAAKIAKCDSLPTTP